MTKHSKGIARDLLNKIEMRAWVSAGTEISPDEYLQCWGIAPISQPLPGPKKRIGNNRWKNRYKGANSGAERQPEASPPTSPLVDVPASFIEMATAEMWSVLESIYKTPPQRVNAAKRKRRPKTVSRKKPQIPWL
jgi:hypothetical protein